MIDFNAFLQIMLYICLIVLIIILIILGIRLIRTLKKVDDVIDDVNLKMGKVGGLFEIIDKTTDYASLISDKALGVISSLINVFIKKKKGRGNDEEE